MKTSFKTVQKLDPRDPTGPRKYHPALKYKGNIGTEELINEINRFTTVSQADTMAVLHAFLEVVPTLLKRGWIVQLGNLGSLYITINSTGEEKEEDVTQQNIRKANVRFRIGQGLRSALANISFTKVAS